MNALGRPCSVCVRADRKAIDSELVHREPNRRVAARYGLTEQAVRRHRNGHLPSTLARAHNAQEIAWADGLLDQLRDLQRRTLVIMSMAETAGDVRTALVSVAVARDNLGLLLKMWSSTGRPAWWTGEPRWNPPPDPAAKAKARAEQLADMPDHLKAGLRAWLIQRRQDWIAREHEAAERHMRSFMPDGGADGNGDGPR